MPTPFNSIECLCTAKDPLLTIEFKSQSNPTDEWKRMRFCCPQDREGWLEVANGIVWRNAPEPEPEAVAS